MASAPISLCLEELGESGARIHRCVALVGRRGGLGLDPAGELRWDEPRAVELWVSADDRLVLLRCAGAPPVVVERDGRTLEVPEEKPVFVLHLDEIRLGARSLRLHVHGPVAEVAPPAPVAVAGRPLAGLATALALGGVVGMPASGERVDSLLDPPPIEIRDQPPDPYPVDPPKRKKPKPPPKKKAPPKRPPGTDKPEKR